MPIRRKIQTYIIVENEKISANKLKLFIEELFPRFHLLEICYTSIEAISAINELKPDLVFVDILLENDQLSFSLFDQVFPDNYKIIFISEKTNHHNSIFDYQVVDIITKPYQKEDIIQAVRNAEKRNFLSKDELNLLEANYHQHDVLEMEFSYEVEVIDEALITKEIHFIKFKDIIAFKAYKSRRSKIISTNKILTEQIIEAPAVSSLKNKLPNCFHYTKSAIINVHHITSYAIEDRILCMTGDIFIKRITKEDFEEMSIKKTGFELKP